MPTASLRVLSLDELRRGRENAKTVRELGESLESPPIVALDFLMERLPQRRPCGTSGRMSDATEAEVLQANAGFYAAFAAGDFAAMEAVWSDAQPVVCVHPGWPPIRGRDPVLASFRSIFDNDSGTAPVCENPTCSVFEGGALVVCRERLGNAILVATNVFAKRDGRWTMVHHHASALARVPETPPIDPELLPN